MTAGALAIGVISVKRITCRCILLTESIYCNQGKQNRNQVLAIIHKLSDLNNKIRNVLSHTLTKRFVIALIISVERQKFRFIYQK